MSGWHGGFSEDSNPWNTPSCCIAKVFLKLSSLASPVSRGTRTIFYRRIIEHELVGFTPGYESRREMYSGKDMNPSMSELYPLSSMFPSQAVCRYPTKVTQERHVCVIGVDPTENGAKIPRCPGLVRSTNELDTEGECDKTTLTGLNTSSGL